MNKELTRACSMLGFFALAVGGPQCVQSCLLVFYTLCATCLIEIISKRRAYLIIMPEPHRVEKVMLVVVYVVVLLIETELVRMYRGVCRSVKYQSRDP